VTESIPKALVEVAGRPFAVHQLELLRRKGLRRVVFCLGYRGEQVAAALGDGAAWGMEIEYSFDGPTLLGTGGAVRQALPLLGETFFVLYGDSYLDCDYAAVEAAFHASGQPALMTVFANAGRWDQSNVQFEGGRLLRYDKQKRTPEMRHIDYGLGVFQSSVFERYPPGAAFDLATMYQDLLRAGRLAGFEVDRRFYEIGSPAGLAETDRFLTQQAHGAQKDELRGAAPR
jgi:NDP-sugar pyrophosphorylase family protein